MAEIHRKDYDTYQEYHREIMKFYNRRKHYQDRLDRFGEVYDLIKRYEKDGADRATIVKQLADRCKYKPVKDKTIMEGE